MAILIAMPAFGAIEPYAFETQAQREQYQRFTHVLRCPKCQNQNLAGSDAPIAADLRRELRRLVAARSSDAEIVDFMVDRYGEFVLYEPPVDRHTVLLWAAPGIFLAVGLLLLVLVARRRGRGDPTVSEPALDAQEQARLAELLARQAPADARADERSDPGRSA